MIQKEDLQRAIGIHLLWRTRLKVALESGLAHPAAESLRRKDQCEFGKWLRAQVTSSGGSSGHLQTVDQLHEAFHQAAAEVVEQGLGDETTAASSRGCPGGAFLETSEQLILAMKAWHESLS